MAAPGNYRWQWLNDSGWTNYDVKTSCQIEQAFNTKSINVRLKHGYFKNKTPAYHVDMSRPGGYYQINVKTSFKRPVRRIVLKGGGGKGGGPFSLPSGGGGGGKSGASSRGGGFGRIGGAVPKSSTAGPFWSWRDDFGWKKYDPTTSQAIETAFSLMNAKNVTLSHGYFASRPFYKVEFESDGMWQTNSRTGYRRQVRRHDGSRVQYKPSEAKTQQTGSTGSISSAPTATKKTAHTSSFKKIAGMFTGLSSFGSASSSSSGNGNKASTPKPQLLTPGKLLVVEGKTYRFGPAATAPPPTKKTTDATPLENAPKQIAQMLRENVEGVEKLRGQRGELSVTEMLQNAYQRGLFMHGGPSSPVNSMIIPAIRHVMAWCNKQNKADPKRKHILHTLAHACLDCQQVQAREILRLHRELTNQAQTLPLQIGGFLNPLKEGAIDNLISLKHAPLCDQDHTKATPGQQRPHLRSAYVAMAGDIMGMRDTLPSKNDRFLYNAKSEVTKILPTGDAKHVAEELMKSISVKLFFNGLLSDINNQSKTADRTIDHKCIFQWAKDNLKDPNVVFYDEDNPDSYKDQLPDKPLKENEYQPFLSKATLLEMLVKMKFLLHDPNAESEAKGASNPADSKMEEDSKTDEFRSWLEKSKLKKESVEKILQDGITSKDSFREISKLEFQKMGLNLGQSVIASRLASSLMNTSD